MSPDLRPRKTPGPHVLGRKVWKILLICDGTGPRPGPGVWPFNQQSQIKGEAQRRSGPAPALAR